MALLLTGVVALALGAPPEAKGACTLEGVLRVVDAKGQALPQADGVVYVASPLDDGQRPTTRVMKQLWSEGELPRRFEPRLLVVRQYDQVDFTNDTSFPHEVNVDLKANVFTVAQNKRKNTHSEVFDQLGTSFVGCRMHREMQAVVLTVPNAFFVQVGSDGRWRLTGLPRRPLQLSFWANGNEEIRTVTPCAEGTLEVTVQQGTRPPTPPRYGPLL